MEINKIYQGDALEVLKTFESESVDCCITSPPYFSLRDYGVDGQIGLEKTPEEYVDKLVGIFRELKRVLKKEGTFWLNLGDSYASTGKEGGDIDLDTGMDIQRGRGRLNKHAIIKPKDLIGIPWRVAFALQADGWYLRQDIIWHKPNPMPESVMDRCTKCHEYVFLLTKAPKYFFDYEAIQETATSYDGRKDTFHKGSPKYINGFAPTGTSPQTVSVKGHERWKKRKADGTDYGGDGSGFQGHSGYDMLENPYVRNKRDVWTVNTKPYAEAHFATFPPNLITPMVRAGCPKEVCVKCGKAREKIIEKGELENERESRIDNLNVIPGRDMPSRLNSKNMETLPKAVVGYSDCGCGEGFKKGLVLDPFSGSSTTGEVALQAGRNYVGIELNPKYVELGYKRITPFLNPLF